MPREEPQPHTGTEPPAQPACDLPASICWGHQVKPKAKPLWRHPAPPGLLLLWDKELAALPAAQLLCHQI